MSESVTITLNAEDRGRLVEALDAYEYWQLGHELPRNDGLVFLPDDEGAARFWSSDEWSSEAHAEVIEGIKQCRQLAERLRSA